jgi:2-(3-amino-3-carboxypropyl)histidine synthase
MKKQIEGTGRKVFTYRTRHSFMKGHLLGCAVEDFGGEFDAFLYVGDGLFHPQALLLNNDKKVLMYNPFDKKTRVIEKKDIEKALKRRKGALVKFLSSENIGVLVTTKAGQQQLDSALKLKEKFPEKKFYILISNDIDFEGLADFPFVECFVNTACPRIAYDDIEKFSRPVIDITEIRKLTDGSPYDEKHTAKKSN